LQCDDGADLCSAERLLPTGCATVAEAAARILSGTDDVSDLDRVIQQRLSDTAGGLARICLTANDLPSLLGPMLVESAKLQLAARQNGSDAADLFAARYPGESGRAALMTAWRAAAPPWIEGAELTEVTTVIAPAPLTELARQAFGNDARLCVNADEITVLRTVPVLPLATIPQFGQEARAIYQRRKSAGDSPHARADLINLQKD